MQMNDAVFFGPGDYLSWLFVESVNEKFSSLWPTSFYARTPPGYELRQHLCGSDFP